MRQSIDQATNKKQYSPAADMLLLFVETGLEIVFINNKLCAYCQSCPNLIKWAAIRN